jgi:hypothetical protein
MENIGIFVALAVGFPALGAQLARADDASLREMVLRDYPQALATLENRLSSAKGVVRRSIERRAKAGSRVSTQTFAFECKRPYMARVVSDGNVTRTRGDIETSKHVLRVLCYNRDYSFQLGREDANTKWSLTSLENSQDGRSNEGVTMTHSLSVYLGAPYSMWVRTLSSLFSEEGFSVRAVSPISHRDKQMLKIEFDRKPSTKAKAKANGRGDYQGWLVVSLDEAWVLYSYEYMDKARNAWRGTVEYGEVRRGIPVPKRVVHTIEGAKEDGLRSQLTYDFDEISLVDVPDRDFTLAAFGFPEFSQTSGRPGRSLGPWLLTLSVLAMAAAIILKVASSRIQSKDALNRA